jgi:hypothetical protein
MVPFLSQIDPVHTIPSHPISLKSILILSTHLRLVLPSGLFPSVFELNYVPLYEDVCGKFHLGGWVDLTTGVDDVEKRNI